MVIILHKRNIKSFFFLTRCKQSPDGRLEVKGQHGSSSLQIKDVKLSDSGRYDCEAASRIGGHQKSMYLDIECKLFSFCMLTQRTCSALKNTHFYREIQMPMQFVSQYLMYSFRKNVTAQSQLLETSSGCYGTLNSAVYI